ncbi:ribosomal RNA processing protein 1 homolog B [Ictalurus furcatus]|uniref:ribosomal RNA processing protein 1 homolog B n=1 Tax=Ictalurus furcatus TaxID=66913 RepID=UPI0023507D16|nr:ribosomal RNA processing protein 1 homolog B [Ictalurus furcatus]
MAPGPQEPEIILAQRLASNDKSIRTKALKALRKYINLRSQKIEGGFTSEDLLKIWKGLFYCLWMQDKPLLQEELSHRISGLIHSFQTTDNQLLYFATFLQTVKREWNGIDRLRMDKFYQLVRFMFRQAFEVLKRREWESSAVNQFLQVFTDQILQNTDHVPKGLILHILDLYMAELAQVGSAELTAEQNQTFINPFCKTMAKTKDCFLLSSISKNIFRTIVDHAPYAIEDLMRELQQGGGDDSDSGQASGEEEEEDIGEEEELKNKACKKPKVKVKGISEEVENSKGSKDDLDLNSMGSEVDDCAGPVLQFDYGAIADHLFELGSHFNTRNINRTKMYNLVKTFRDLSEGIFPQTEDDDGDLSDTSDDEKFNKKKSKKKKRKNEKPTTGDETLAKKSKAIKKKATDTSPVPLEADGTPREQDMEKERVVLKDNSQHHELDSQQKTSEIEADGETVFRHNESDSQSQLEASITVKKKMKSKKLKTNSQNVGEEAHEFQLVLEESDGEHQSDSVMKQKSFKAMSGVGSTQTSTNHKPEMASLVESPVEADQAECGVSLMQEKNKKKNKKKKLNMGEEKMDTETNGQIVEKPSKESSLHSHLVTTETEVDKTISQGGDSGQLEASTMVRKKRTTSKNLCSSLQEVGEEVAVQSLKNIRLVPKEHNAGDEIRKLSTHQKGVKDNATQRQLGTSTTQIKKVKRKNLKASLKEGEVAVKSPAILDDPDEHNNDDEISRHPCPTSEEDSITQCGLKASTTKKKKGKSKNLMSSSQGVGKEVNSTSQDSCTEVVATGIATPAAEVTSAEAQPSDTLMVRTKKSKKMKSKEETGSKLQVALDVKEAEVTSYSAHITTNENKGDTSECFQSKSVKKGKNKKQISSNEEECTFEAKKQPAVETASTTQTHTTPQKIQKRQESQPAEEAKEDPILKKTVTDTVPSDDICTPQIKSLTPMKKGKKKRKLQTEEAETSQSNGYAEEQMGGKKVKISGIEVSTSVTPKKLKMEKASPKSDFISFRGQIYPPTPLFCKTKPKGSTPLTSIKKFQTPKSETKKVTFGLKNNKTTEFRKMDRSLLVSPVGSSRVAFDPKKMPVSGVLKSPSLSPVISVKKTAAKKRATAADFF